MINSRYPLFSATSISLTTRGGRTYQRHTFSRSYGVNLPSSLTRVLSSALEFSSYPPVSVYGTGTLWARTRDFSWKRRIDPLTGRPKVGSSAFPLDSSPAFVARSLLPDQSTGLNRHYQRPADLAFSVLPCRQRRTRRYRNVDLFAIDYAFRPRLRTRLTLGG